MKKKTKRKLLFWSVIIIGGFALIVLADALCEIIRNALGSNYWMFWGSLGIILILLIVGFRRRIMKLAEGQLGM